MGKIDILGILENLLNEFMAAVPNFVGALLVFIIGYFLSRLVSRLILAFFQRIGIDKLAQKLNDIDLFQRSNINLVPSVLLSKLVYYVLIIIFAIAATDILGMPAVSELMSDIINYIPYLLSAFIVMAVGLFIADFVKKIVATTCLSLGVPSANIIAGVVFWFLFLTVLMSALAQARINTSFITSSFTVIIGGVVLAFAIGYGLASRDTMANYLASFAAKERYKIGDMLRIGEQEGEVVAMDSNILCLKTSSGVVHIPFSKLNRENVTKMNHLTSD